MSANRLPLDPEASFCVLTQAGPAYVDTVYGDDERPVRVLQVGGAYQSATYFGEDWHELVFEYYRSFDRMFEAADQGLRISRVLVIGGGGCSYPKHLLMSHADVSVDVVECDPVVVDLAYEYFFVDRLRRQLTAAEGSAQRFNMITQDGLTYLEETDQRYDVIINDAFDGCMPIAELVAPQALELAFSRLNSGGLYLTNVVCDQTPESYAYLHDLLAAMREAFGHAYSFMAIDEDYGEAENYLIIATEESYEFADAIGE